MATPYDANNTGGTLPLPRIHIPTWFTINSVSEHNDALLDLDLLDSSITRKFFVQTDISYGEPGTVSFTEYGSDIQYELYYWYLFRPIYITNLQNRVLKYGIQLDITMSLEDKTNSIENFSGNRTLIWTVNANNTYKVFNSNNSFMGIALSIRNSGPSNTLNSIYRVIKQFEEEKKENYSSEIENSWLFEEGTDVSVNTSLSLSNYEMTYMLEETYTENLPYLVVNDIAYSEGNYLTTNSNGNYLTIPISDIHVNYDKTGFSYTILLDKPYEHTYTFPWSKIENFPSLLVSTVRLAKEIWPKILQDIIPANTFSSEEEALIFANNNWPSSDDFWDIITNERDLVKEEIESLGMDPVLTIPITVELGNKDTVVIGDTVPELGSIIAYSYPAEFLPDTNSSHILYFKNAELKSFNFAVQNNTVIDRIEKLYRYAGLGTNLTTELENINNDPNFKNMKIKEGTAEVLENIQTLFLTEGSVVASA